MDIADPETLPAADHGADDQADKDDGDRAPAALVHELGGQRADQTDRGADGQVDVAARQDAQQHAAGQNQNIGVLEEEVGHVLRIEQTALGQDAEQDKHSHKGYDHRVFLNKGFHIFAHRVYSPLYFFSEFRIAAMIFSCEASAISISATILPAFMT